MIFCHKNIYFARDYNTKYALQMELSPKLLVYKASAGSGKTFTLAVEYIKKLILNPRAYRTILAVTFTNKATTEMKERILSQLYGIWIGDPASESYLNNIREEIDLPTEEIRKAAGTALNLMIHDYSRFRVETIDSFFQSIMRNLARELELTPNLDLELNNSEVLSEAVDSMIEKLDRHSPVLVWLLDYIQERIASDKRWNVSGELKKFGKNIFDEGYMERGAGLRLQLQEKDCIRNYRKKLEIIRTEAIEQMKSFADQFFGIIEEAGLSTDDFAYGRNGVSGYFINLQNQKLDDKIAGMRVQKCMESEEAWVTKTSPYKEIIRSLATSQLMDLLQTAEKFRKKNSRIINSCNLSLRHINNIRLLANIDEEVRCLNKENSRFLLSDTNALLHRLVRQGDSPFVFEKIGASIRHIMIDEFQDTSRMQWDNFRILLLEGLSHGADSLIVGDVKQSIYRWRNGDWSILNNLKDHIETFPVQVKTLTINRRSENCIIHFNNLFFTEAAAQLNEIYQTDFGKECKELKDAYQDVCQTSPNKEEKGYVQIQFMEEDEEKNYTELTLESLAMEVQSLIEKGVSLSDLTILVRKNKNIPLIADYFDKHLPYKIVSDEAFRLDASLSVCMIIDGMRFLSNPSNKIAKAQLVTAYQQEILQKDIDLNTILLDEEQLLLPEDFINRINTLRLMPLYEVAEEIFSIFNMSRLANQNAYLFAFFDALTEYLQNHSSDIDSFLRYWDEKLCTKTIPSGEIEGIRILSIHKSKGLEFHTVLLPFCDWKLENETNNQLVWCAPSESPFNELELVPVNYSSVMAQSVYQSDYENERLQLWIDNLNLLYVAFTRAAKNLYIWSKKGQKGTVSELLFNSLSKLSEKKHLEWDPDTFFSTGTFCTSQEQKQKVSTNKLTMQPQKREVKIESFYPDVKFRQSNRSADFIRGEEEAEKEQKYIRQGQLLHHLFSEIRTRQDIESAIDHLLFEGYIDSEKQRKEILRITERALSHPLVQDWYSGSWQLFNECTIVCKEGEKLETRRPDRVMKKDNQMIVVDFKFGKHRPEYQEQMQKYMQLLSRMGYENLNGYIWYVYENKLEEITWKSKSLFHKQ